MSINKLKVSDGIAKFLKQKEIRHVFGIIGSANSHIFDSINRLGYTEIVCVHHEQAATMAMQTYFRTNGKITAALVTAGGGSSNAITGVISAWADSLPGIIISGQENTRFIESMHDMRMWGIQGFDSTLMVSKVTKYSARVMDPKQSIYELEKAYYISGHKRPGPVWIDYPMDIQGATIPINKFNHYSCLEDGPTDLLDSEIQSVLKLIASSKRPVFWLGHGVRLSGAIEKVNLLLEKFQFPTLVTWAGIDILDHDHPLNYGRAGVYGNRAANFIAQNSDLIISIGNRFAIPMIGYEHSEFAREAKIIQVDIDKFELEKTHDMVDLSIESDAGDFIDRLISMPDEINYPDLLNWTKICNGYMKRYPYIGPENEDKNGFINSCKFISFLSGYFKPDQVITTDMGTALLSGHQVIRIKDKQRLMTSTGLGEMGYGLPAAIGASFARNKGEVICLNCDGGIMMNLQELQTIDEYNLPIKTFIFNNDGYLMIKHTQKNLFKGNYVAVNKKTNISCPNLKKLASTFNMKYYLIKNWADFKSKTKKILSSKKPIICEILMNPEQYFHPKLGTAINKKGKIISPPLEDLSPLLNRTDLKKNMIVPIHKKSKEI